MLTAAGCPACGSSSGATWTVTATPLLVTVWCARAGAALKAAIHAASAATVLGFMFGVLLGLRDRDWVTAASARRPPDPVAGHEQAAGAQQRPAGGDGHDEGRA